MTNSTFNIFLILTILVTGSGASNASDETTPYKRNIGVGAGFITGSGLSYRHWFPSDFGFQVNIAPFITGSKQEKSTEISAGLTGLKIITHGNVVNLFAYAGGNVWYEYHQYQLVTYDSRPNQTEITQYSKETKFTFGAGPGMDIHFWHLSINLMAGIAGYTSNNKTYGIQFSGETALYYSF